METLQLEMLARVTEVQQGEWRAPAAKPLCKFSATLFDKQQQRLVYMQRLAGHCAHTAPLSGTVMLERWHTRWMTPCPPRGYVARPRTSSGRPRAQALAQTRVLRSARHAPRGSNVSGRSDGPSVPLKHKVAKVGWWDYWIPAEVKSTLALWIYTAAGPFWRAGDETLQTPRSITHLVFMLLFLRAVASTSEDGIQISPRTCSNKICCRDWRLLV